jgi:hypothetical protein
MEMPMPARGITREKLRELARAGAAAALKTLRSEIIAIERTFPELALPSRRRALRRSVRRAASQTRKVSAETRRMISERMKRYWAERRKARSRVK